MKKEHKLTCGIEIHQQLEGKKLFCNCPAMIQERVRDYIVERKIRAVVGETGEIDIAAAYEAQKGKKFIYECYNDNVCLIDLDEAPPNELNKDVFNTALQVCKLLKAIVVDEVQVMRKTVVDGSNAAGFQRTALVGLNGQLETSEGVVSIPTIFVEEDSARPMKREADKVTYRLDRLGIPLFEIATGPDMHSPEHCAEVAEKLGMLLRATGKCKRGIGTIRQDINVSIPGGTRVELKGAQDLKLITSLVKFEADRQKNLLKIKDDLRKRTVKKLNPKFVNVSGLFLTTNCGVVNKTLTSKGKVLAVKLDGFDGFLGREVQLSRRLGSEFSDYAKIKAGVGGIFHSDEELTKYGFSDKEISNLKNKLKVSDKDAFVLCAAQEQKVSNALRAVVDRANYCFVGVPNEVRDAKPDATSVFLRPMPGAARLYPETDVPPILVDKNLLAKIKLPELIEDKVARFVKLGLSKDLAELLAKSARTFLFDKFIKKFKNIKPAFLAETLATIDRIVRREFNVEISPSDEDFEIVFTELDKGKIDKASIIKIFKENKSVKKIIKNFYLTSDADVEKTIKQIVNKNKGAPFNALMGLVMKELRGKASGETVMKILKKLVK